MNFKYLAYLLFVFICLSCKKENLCDCFKSTGSTNIIYHDVKDFTCIELKDKMDLYITQGPVFEVKVEAGENLQRLIKTELDGETLKVYNSNKCNVVRGYKHKIKIHITAPYFKYLKNVGLGTIESTGTIAQNDITVRIENSGDVKLNVNTHSFAYSVHGNGDMYVQGVTDEFFGNYNGTNYLYAKDLTINHYAYINSLSIGHGYIKAPENGLMDVVIDRSGNIYYTGNPSVINLTRNNKGDLVKE